MNWLDIEVGLEYRITYPNENNDKRHEGKVATVVRAMPMGDFVLKFKNGKTTIYHGSWLEPV